MFDTKAGQGALRGGALGEKVVALAVDPSAIMYLHERDRVSKVIVTTVNEPSPLGWAAVMSQHGTSDGRLTLIRAAVSGARRLAG